MFYRNDPWQCPCIYARNNVKNIILNRLVKLIIISAFCKFQQDLRMRFTFDRFEFHSWSRLMNSTLGVALHDHSPVLDEKFPRAPFCPSVYLSERGRDQKLKMLWILVLYIWFRVMPGSCRIYYVFSLRKDPFLFALCRWGRSARKTVCDSATEIPYQWRKSMFKW